MEKVWIVMGATIAIVAVAVPIAVITLVSFASLREESAHTLSGDAPSLVARLARRLLGFRGEFDRSLVPWPEPESIGMPEREVRFDHARRTLPDSRKQPAGREPQPGAIRREERQGAGV